jgi:hypothetical protein
MDVLLIELNAQSGLAGDGHKSIAVRKRAWIENVVEQVVLLVVVDSQALFLNESVVADSIKLETGRQRNRAQWAVQCERNVIGFGHSSDLTDFGDSARM